MYVKNICMCTNFEWNFKNLDIKSKDEEKGKREMGFGFAKMFLAIFLQLQFSLLIFFDSKT